jgi:excisionase family DNA binding protein
MTIEPQTSVKPIRLYKLPEVADLLGVSIPGIRQMLSDGDLKSKRVGKNGHIRIPGQSILDYIAKDSTPHGGRTAGAR